MEFGRVWSRHQRTLLITMMMFKLGFLCTAAADKCLSSPCSNGATCLEHLGDYVCLCPREPVWFAGRHCEQLYDACATAPCANCSSAPGSGAFACVCPDGLAGPNCTEDADECRGDPCRGARSRCVDAPGGYSCHCPAGWAGPDCRDNVTTCAAHACRNGGSCVDVPDAGHRCVCADGFEGRSCEEDVDECRSEPCQNGAICKDGPGGYQCFCVPGFQGYHCDLDINECASRPCHNNGTCLDQVDHYACDCAPGFKGTNCEEEIDECEALPCRHGATCWDHVAAYTCECLDGFQGRDCEVDVDECASAPCLHQGRCMDGVNSFECDCGGTGFTGDHCEQDIPECASDPCQHGATCVEGTNEYRCLCWPGYEGVNCQLDIDECEQRPCENGGECFQRSDVPRYGTLPELGSANFSYEAAAGFVCRCVPGFTGGNCSVNVDECQSAPCQHAGSCEDLVDSYRCVCPDGFTGVHCELDINECDSDPCRNGATCQDAANSYRCHCPAPARGQDPWGGRDCDVALLGCRRHLCQHGAGCVPGLGADGEHTYSCRCTAGWSGERCNTSTTFSFGAKGYVHMHLPALRNRTEPQSDGGGGGEQLQVRLRFRTTLPDMVLFYRGTADSFLSLELVGGGLQARLKAGKALRAALPGPLNDGEWRQVAVTMGERLALSVTGPGCEEACRARNEGANYLIFLQAASFQQLFVGGAPPELLARLGGRRGFVGCMEDLTVDRQLLLPQDLLREENKGLELGCSKQDWCRHAPCRGRGRCLDMWLRASCQCHRPYHGEHCEKELPAWTFGHENSSSFASFNVSETHGDNFTVSFLLRSLKRAGLLLQFRRGARPYLSLYLKEGTVAVYSPHTTLLSEAAWVADGNNNLVVVKVRDGHVAFPKAGNQRALGNVSVEQGDLLYVGGLPQGRGAGAWGGGFKGCLQDLRLDHKLLLVQDPPEGAEEVEGAEGTEVYRASGGDNVLPGCQSDDTCQAAPCLNGGSCRVTWNDFLCDCTPHYSDRLCGTRVWCVDRPCPDGVRCVDLRDGYECLTEAIFQDNAIQYAANGSLLGAVTSVSMAIRTRDEDGVLLRAVGRTEVFCVGLLNSSLLVKLDNNQEGTELLAFTSDRAVADGAWHHVQLAMADPAAPASRWRLSVDGRRAGGSFGLNGNLNFLNDTTIRLAERYTGCLGEVRVGGVYLPLVGVPEAPQASRFARLDGHEPVAGCRGEPVCDSQPCLNQGECQDQFNQFNCSCGAGWEGERCEAETDECAAAPCVHGACSDLLADYRCECEPGYQGKDCGQEVDDCLRFSCVNGGECVETVGTHTCSCPAGYVGKRCQWRFPPVACDANTECLNGGVCIGGDLGGNCTCKPGYTGARCESEVDECLSSPCLHGATCLNRLNHFQCVCAPGFSGTLCDSNKEEQAELIPWLAVTIPLTTLCVLLAILTAFFLVLTCRKKRQSEGTYSPSSQEVAGARLEMGSVLKVPPEERLI